MVSVNALSGRLGVRWHTVKDAIKRGDLNAMKVGQTWVVSEDEALERFRQRMEHLLRVRLMRRKRLKDIWAFDPERMKKPPRKVVKLTPKITMVWLKPIRYQIATDSNSAVCPHCHNRVLVDINVNLEKEVVLSGYVY